MQYNNYNINSTLTRLMWQRSQSPRRTAGVLPILAQRSGSSRSLRQAPGLKDRLALGPKIVRQVLIHGRASSLRCDDNDRLRNAACWPSGALAGNSSADRSESFAWSSADRTERRVPKIVELFRVVTVLFPVPLRNGSFADFCPRSSVIDRSQRRGASTFKVYPTSQKFSPFFKLNFKPLRGLKPPVIPPFCRSASKERKIHFKSKIGSKIERSKEKLQSEKDPTSIFRPP